MVERETSAQVVRDDIAVVRAWLREFSMHNGVEVSTAAEERMLRLDVSLLDVNYVLANGELIFCDNDENGCTFVIAGETCDDHVLEVVGGFASGHMFLIIESVSKLG